jgi:hypothetical protein
VEPLPLPPTGHLTIAEAENWVALLVFLLDHAPGEVVVIRLAGDDRLSVRRRRFRHRSEPRIVSAA